MSVQSKRSKTTVEKFTSTRHQFTVGQKVLDRFTVTTPAVPGTLGEDYHAIDTKSKKPYVLQVLSPDISNNLDFIEHVAKHLYVCASIREADLVPAGELLQSEDLKLRMIACQDYGQESVESRQEIIEAGGKFGVKALLGFLERAATALDKLALAGRAHLALRPADIVITSHGNVMITNWWYNWDLLQAAAQGKMGAAATVQNSLLSNKHSTLAPEVFRALRLIAGFETGEVIEPGRLADQYSLALIFARTLHHGAVTPASAPLTPVQLAIDKVPFLNQAQREILGRALSPQPLDRFESCSSFLKALQWELPGTEYLPEKGFRDRLFEHVVGQQAVYADDGPWEAFLQQAAEHKCNGFGDSAELLKRARFIWEVHFGHPPTLASAPEFDQVELTDFATASETPQQRYDRLKLLFEELHAGISTSGFAVAADIAPLLDQAETLFDTCNPRDQDGAAPAVPPVRRGRRVGGARLAVASAALSEVQPAGASNAGSGAGGRSSSVDEPATGHANDRASTGSPSAAPMPVVKPATKPVRSSEPAPVEAPVEAPAEPAAAAAPVDPIALLDAFAPVTGTAPVIEPPPQGGASNRSAGDGRKATPPAGNMPMSGAMVSEFRESVRSTKPSLTPSSRVPPVAQAQPSPRAAPPPLEVEAPRPGYDAPPAEDSHSPPALPLNEGLDRAHAETVVLNPLGDFTTFCNRAGSHLELLEFRFSYVPEGGFIMGREVGKPNERPTHRVQLGTGFFLAVGTVTNKFYKYFVDSTGHPPPGHPRHPERNLWTAEGYPPELEDYPVVNVSWNDARLFCAWLTEWAHSHDLISGHAAVDLPTEAQWEFACRGGPSQMRLKQQTIVCDRDATQGNPTVPSLYEAAPPLGLCGMLGNVWEWCLDGYAPYQPSHTGSPQLDPISNPEGPNRIIRGGGWKSKLDLCTPYERAELPPHRTEPFLGFRPAVVYRPRH